MIDKQGVTFITVGAARKEPNMPAACACCS